MKEYGRREYKVDVAGVEYGEDRIETAEIVQALFDSPSVGGTACGTFTMTFRPTEAPPRMAEVRPYARDDGEEAWTPLGVFWIDQRTENGGRLEITAYDAMLRAEREWIPEGSLAFPMSMASAAGVIARLMGTELDSRCAFRDYTVDYPANGYTLRDVLGFIAAAHGGNWFVTAEGKLLLAPLYGFLPEEDA